MKKKKAKIHDFTFKQPPHCRIPGCNCKQRVPFSFYRVGKIIMQEEEKPLTPKQQAAFDKKEREMKRWVRASAKRAHEKLLRESRRF